jgi:GT2 family glycosyltransferase
MAVNDSRIQKVSVIVVNWNGKDYLKGCISSVLAQSYGNIEVLVVDSGSTDGSVEFMKESFPNVEIVSLRENVGFCKAFNEGCRKSRGEYVLALNSDTLLDRRFVEEILRPMNDDPGTGAASGKILRFDRRTLDSTGQFIGRDRRPRERGYNETDRGRYEKRGTVFSVCGAVAFYRRKMLDQVALDGQYFDEDYFAFNEDLDLGWRAQLQGWKCAYVPGAIAYHERGGTAGRGNVVFSLAGGRQFARRSSAIRYHIVKNRYMTIIKNDSLESLLADMPCILAFEALLWSFSALTSPLLLFKVPGMVREVLSALPKRKLVQSRRSVSYGYIRKGID